jgi:hypothetical protein
MESLANALLTTDWDNFANSESGMTSDSVFEAIVQQDKPFRKGQSPCTKPKGQAAAQEFETSNQGCVPYAYTEFMTNHSQKNGFVCQVCRFEERGKRLLSVDICTKHCLRLCTRSYERETIFKKDGKEITDYSWVARPNDSMSCWEKAHTFYIPKGLFLAGVIDINQERSSKEKLKFAKVALSSECYIWQRGELLV